MEATVPLFIDFSINNIHWFYLKKYLLDLLSHIFILKFIKQECDIQLIGIVVIIMKN